MGSGLRFEPRLIADRYQLTTLLGHGGMADVYRARDTRLDRDVAVKVFRSVTDGPGHHRFAEEARILARLAHPGLVTVHDSGFSDGDPFLVMRLVNGKTLAARLADGPLPVPEVLALARQLVPILSYVHDAGIVHRDVKPSNVLLGDEQAYLADFGISRLIGTGDRVTEAGKIMGTVGYLSPEQVRGADATQAVDVYALGLVLLECVTGRPEYEGIGVEAAIARLHRPPRVPGHLTAPLSTVIEAMTETKPERRPSMAECVARLEGPPRSPRARRRWAVLGSAVAGAAAVASVSATLLVESGEPITQPPALPPAVHHSERPATSPAQVGPVRSGDLAATEVGQPAEAPAAVVVPANDATHGNSNNSNNNGKSNSKDGHGKANGAGKGNDKGPRTEAPPAARSVALTNETESERTREGG